MLEYLDRKKLTENTIVIYSSDQGFWLGEHGWFDKRWMYEESLHTPLLVRWPNQIKPQSKNDLLVSNLDFAPTFLELAGAKPMKDMQGQSLLPLFKGNTPKDWRKTHYYHYYEAGGHGVPIHYGVTDGKQKLIRFPDNTLNTWEFFDLEADPMEMKNLYAEKSYRTNIQLMKKELHRLRKLYKIED
jgi:arylsulfatase A-like enzyme